MVTRHWYIKPLLHKAPPGHYSNPSHPLGPDQTFDACYPMERRPAPIRIFTQTWVLFAASCKHKRIITAALEVGGGQVARLTSVSLSVLETVPHAARQISSFRTLR